MAFIMVKDTANGAGGLGSIPKPVKSDAVSPPLRRFCGAVLSRRFAAEMSPAISYTLRRNTARIIDLIKFFAMIRLLNSGKKL